MFLFLSPSLPVSLKSVGMPSGEDNLKKEKKNIEFVKFFSLAELKQTHSPLQQVAAQI